MKSLEKVLLSLIGACVVCFFFIIGCMGCNKADAAMEDPKVFSKNVIFLYGADDKTVALVKRNFDQFNVFVTNNSDEYFKRDKFNRIFVKFTNEVYRGEGAMASWDYGVGLAYVPLTPEFPELMAVTASHEVGHVLGLDHQFQYAGKDCNKIAEYGPGDYIMGSATKYMKSNWSRGHPCNPIDEVAFIKSKFK